MEKFIILNLTGSQFVISADIHDAVIVGTKLRLSYLDKQLDIVQSSSSLTADVTALTDAVKAVWAQGYTKPSITIDLPSGAVTGIFG